jgi:hypothetical protein
LLTAEAGRHSASDQHRDPIAEALRLVHEMGDENDGRALPANALDQFPYLARLVDSAPHRPHDDSRSVTT